MMLRLLAAGLISLGLFQGAYGASDILAPANPGDAGFSADGITKLDATMDKAVDSGEVAGIETMLVRHGAIVDVHVHGVKSFATNAPITRDTIFRMYSQTKPMIGVAMMILYEKGLWKLDDPITKFIPEFADLKVFNGTDASGNPILVAMNRPPTMRELMTHTAGFGYGLEPGNFVDDAFRTSNVLSSNGLKDMIEKIAKIPLRYQPGTKWSYSVAVDIQGYIIEKLSGQPLGEFMRQNIWGPLEMADTGFFVPPQNAQRLSGVFFLAPKTNKLIELTPQLYPPLQDFTKAPLMESGGGGSVSTVDDYARFCQMILNKGTYNGVRIVSPDSIAMMETNQLEPSVAASATDDDPHPIGGDALGFGLDLGITLDPSKVNSLSGAGSVWWGGAAGTWFWIDPKNDLFFLGMVQRFGAGNTGSRVLIDASQNGVYSALTDTSR